MEGGRSSEFADVLEISHEASPLSERVLLLRKIINEFKCAILDSLSPEDPDVEPEEGQDMRIVDAAIMRLKKLSNILTELLSESNNLDYVNDLDDIEAVLKVFEKRRFNVDELDETTREDCLHFINNDLNILMFDRQ